MKISAIICSRKSDIPQNFRENIEKTCGVDCEIIVIDNSQNKHSIFSAYNEGVQRANGEILCFVHEDILFHTQDWGKNIENHFSADANIGMIGLISAHYLPETPLYYAASPFISAYSINTSFGKTEERFQVQWFGDKKIIECVACDGLCFFIKKNLFEKITFDEKHFGGFHYYDMDISMQVIDAGYKVCVCRDVLVEHFWNPNYSAASMKVFNTNKIIFRNKWKHYLPILRGIDVPQQAFDRISELYKENYRLRQIEKSTAYKIGKKMLKPVKTLKKIFK